MALYYVEHPAGPGIAVQESRGNGMDFRLILEVFANMCLQVPTQDWYARRGYKIFQDEASKWMKVYDGVERWFDAVYMVKYIDKHS
jgi:hypothetical protein